MGQQKPFNVWEWTKALGQQHWSVIGSHNTLCGRPMLGRNYAKLIPTKDKSPCADCQRKISFWDHKMVEG